MLSAGDLPSSALLDEEVWWGGGPWACVTYADWLRWSRGGETGSALTLMLWLVLMERPELADLHAEGQRGRRSSRGRSRYADRNTCLLRWVGVETCPVEECDLRICTHKTLLMEVCSRSAGAWRCWGAPHCPSSLTKASVPDEERWWCYSKHLSVVWSHQIPRGLRRLNQVFIFANFSWVCFPDMKNYRDCSM